MTILFDCMRSLGCLAALLGTLACGELASDESAPGSAIDPAATGDPASPAGKPALPAPPAPADLAALMHRVHFAYRDDGDALRGGHDTYLASLPRDAARLAFTPQRAAPGAAVVHGDPVQVETLGAWRGGEPIAAAAAPPTVAVASDGSAVVVRGAVREQLRNTADGVEQTFELDRAPAGAGALTVRVAVTGQPLVGQTETGFHFRAAGSALGVRYGNATWVDADGRRTPLAASMRGGAIEIAVPGDVLDAAAYPAMIDPVIGPEIAVDVPVVAAPADQRIPRVAFDGSQFVVVWQDRRAGLDWDIFGARVDPSGRVVDARDFAVASVAGPQQSPDVACLAGVSCVVVWDDGGSIVAANLPLAGAPGPAFTVAAGPPLRATPRVACDDGTPVPGQRCMVVYFDFAGATPIVSARRIKFTGLDGTPSFPVSVAASSAFGPLIAFAGSQYVVTWQDGGGGSTTLARAARVTPANVVVDPTGFAVSPGGPDRPCAIASDGANALVVYTRGSAYPMPLFAQAVDLAAGAPSGAALRLDTAGSYLCAADFDGANYLAAWADASLLPRGRRISTTGAAIDPAPIALTAAPASSSLYVGLAFGAGAHLAVWEDTRSLGTTGYEIYGARIAPALTRTTRVDTLISLVAISASMFTPDVARNFQNYLVVWADSRGGASDIYGVRFDFAGRLLDPMGIPISTAAAAQTRPAVASDGKQFLVVWDDARSAATGVDIYAARVDERGAVLDPAGVVVSNAPGDQRDPDVAFDDPSQRYQVVWSDLRSGVGTDIYGTQVDRFASVLSPAGVVISAFGPAAQVQPAIANLPGKFLVTWTDTVGAGPPLVWGTTMNNAGGVVSGDFNIDPAASTTSAIASDGNNFLVAWQRNDLTAIEGRIVSPAAALLTAVATLSPIGAGTLDPALAFDGANYGVVYSRAQSLYGRRINPGAVPIDPELLIQAGSGNDLFEPALAASKPDQFFVAYDRFITAPPAHLGVFARTVAF